MEGANLKSECPQQGWDSDLSGEISSPVEGGEVCWVAPSQSWSLAIRLKLVAREPQAGNLSVGGLVY